METTFTWDHFFTSLLIVCEGDLEEGFSLGAMGAMLMKMPIFKVGKWLCKNSFFDLNENLAEISRKWFKKYYSKGDDVTKSDDFSKRNLSSVGRILGTQT